MAKYHTIFSAIFLSGLLLSGCFTDNGYRGRETKAFISPTIKPFPQNTAATKQNSIIEETTSLRVDATYPITGRPSIDEKLKDFVEQKISDFKKTAPEITPTSRYSHNAIHISYTESEALKNERKYHNYTFTITTYTGGPTTETTSTTITFDLENSLQIIPPSESVPQ